MRRITVHSDQRRHVARASGQRFAHIVPGHAQRRILQPRRDMGQPARLEPADELRIIEVGAVRTDRDAFVAARMPAGIATLAQVIERAEVPVAGIGPIQTVQAIQHRPQRHATGQPAATERVDRPERGRRAIVDDGDVHGSTDHGEPHSHSIVPGGFEV